MRHGRALAATCAALLGGAAAAQDCKAPGCAGQKLYPKFESLYIKKYSGPTIVAGSCHGHFQTQWRKWEESCPNGNCDPATAARTVVVSTTESPAEAPKAESPKAAEAPKAVEAPKPAPAEAPKLAPVAPKPTEAPKIAPPALKPVELPKLETAPKPAPIPDTGKSPTVAAPREAIVPGIPAVEISIPAAPAVVIPAIAK